MKYDGKHISIPESLVEKAYTLRKYPQSNLTCIVYFEITYNLKIAVVDMRSLEDDPDFVQSIFFSCDHILRYEISQQWSEWLDYEIDKYINSSHAQTVIDNLAEKQMAEFDLTAVIESVSGKILHSFRYKQGDNDTLSTTVEIGPSAEFGPKIDVYLPVIRVNTYNENFYGDLFADYRAVQRDNDIEYIRKQLPLIRDLCMTNYSADKHRSVLVDYFRAKVKQHLREEIMLHGIPGAIDFDFDSLKYKYIKSVKRWAHNDEIIRA